MSESCGLDPRVCPGRYPITSVVSVPPRDDGSEKILKGTKEKMMHLCRAGRWFRNKAVALVLFWGFVISLLCNHYIHKYTEVLAGETSKSYLIIYGVSIFMPLTGWVTDVYFGRYKVIKSSMILMWFSLICRCFLHYILQIYVPDAVFLKVDIIFITLACIGVGSFQVNIIQFGVDQLLDSSSSDIISYITWYIWGFYLSKVVVGYTHCFINIPLAIDLLHAVLLTLALCSDFLFSYLLVKEPVAHNPLKLIFRVLLYAINNKYPRERSTFSYWDDRECSRLDLAKKIYGGPFIAEQVENVKIFFRILFLIIIACALLAISMFLGRISFLILYRSHDFTDPTDCVEKISFSNFGYSLMTVCIPLWEVILLPLFRKCLPRLRMILRIIIGAILVLLSLISLMCIELIHQRTHSHSNETMCLLDYHLHVSHIESTSDFSYHWLAFPTAVNTIGQSLLLVAGLEFICAQCPYSMKGLVFGSCYTNIGFSSILVFLIGLLANRFLSVILGCIFWFLLICVGLTLTIFLFGSFATVCYKNRERADVYHHQNSVQGYHQ